MGQSSISCFITPQELSNVLQVATDGSQPTFVSEEWNDLAVVQNSIESSMMNSKLGRFYLGYGGLNPFLLERSVRLWDAGFIQFDNPNRSPEYLGQVMVAFHTGLPDSEAYQTTGVVFRKIVREIKKRSTLGKHLFCTMDNRIDKHTWLSEGAHQWMLDGNEVTVSHHLDRIQTEPHVIHKLID